MRLTYVGCLVPELIAFKKKRILSNNPKYGPEKVLSGGK